MKITQLLFLVATTLLIGTLGRTDPNAFDAQFNLLKPRMAPIQVQALLGLPDLKEIKGKREVWHYNANGGREVVFENDRLTEATREEPSGTSGGVGLVLPPTPTPTVAPNTLEIGDSCHTDLECKSKNCHFHQCAGKNNCTVPLGKTCGTNSDCCSNFCDFGTCKKK